MKSSQTINLEKQIYLYEQAKTSQVGQTSEVFIDYAMVLDFLSKFRRME